MRRYRAKPGWTQHVLHTPSPRALNVWEPELVAAFTPFYVIGPSKLLALDALSEALRRPELQASEPPPPPSPQQQ